MVNKWITFHLPNRTWWILSAFILRTFVCSHSWKKRVKFLKRTSQFCPAPQPQDDQRTDDYRNGKVSHKKSAAKRKSGLLMSFICLVVCVLLITLFIGNVAVARIKTRGQLPKRLSANTFASSNRLGCYSAHMKIDGLSNFVDTIASKLGHQGDVRYAVVLDAGSTGSRVLAYKFYTSFVDGRLVLDEELFVEVKPGLSNYHSEPHKVSNVAPITRCYRFRNDRVWQGVINKSSSRIGRRIHWKADFEGERICAALGAPEHTVSVEGYGRSTAAQARGSR